MVTFGMVTFERVRHLGEPGLLPVLHPTPLIGGEVLPKAKLQRPDQLVDLDQIAATVQRSKRTLRRYRHKMPSPVYPGAGSAPDIWYWADVRPWLIETFRMPRLPERLPGVVS